MDLVELRLLAVGGILTLGIVASVLAMAAAALVERFQGVSQALGSRRSGVPAVGPRRGLGAGRA